MMIDLHPRKKKKKTSGYFFSMFDNGNMKENGKDDEKRNENYKIVFGVRI